MVAAARHVRVIPVSAGRIIPGPRSPTDHAYGLSSHWRNVGLGDPVPIAVRGTPCPPAPTEHRLSE